MDSDNKTIANENDWERLLANEYRKPYFRILCDFIEEEYATARCFPPREDILSAFSCTPYNDTKVVILGQDPYHEVGQAHGLAFSVRKGVKIPPSLQNIYKELQNDIGIPIATHGCLTAWANQGVLLLNTVLTVREGEANSHKGRGWERFTDAVLLSLNQREKPLVFIFWGAKAQEKERLITNKRHLILKGAHPSPLSAYRGFFGGKYFSKTNEFLKENNIEEIDWAIHM